MGLLGRSPASMPAVEVLATPPFDVSSNAEAFVRRGDATIYVVASSPAFREARCGDNRSLIRLASVLVHEEWHVRNGSDERGAYEAQLLAILRLGETPASLVYRGVYQSMRVVLQSQKAEEGRRAARQPGTPARQALARR
jgi:hypothetical protein